MMVMMVVMVVRCMVMVVLVAFSTASARGCSSSIVAINIEDAIFVFHAFRLSTLLRVHSLESVYVRLCFVGERAWSIVW